MRDKGVKTIDEQLDILIERGLSIPNREQAAEFLLQNNYYRVSGYSLTLRRHDEFSKNATFQNIIDIYEFDHELRNVLLKYIENIEVTIKSIYAYEFSKVYGPYGYLDLSNFTSEKIYRKTISKAEEQKNSRHPHEAYLKHFIDDLHEDIPLWAYVDLLTIADISFLYMISPKAIKDTVALSMGIKHSGAKLLGGFLHKMTILRNLCAHGGRLFNRLFEQKPKLSKDEEALLRIKPNGTKDIEHLYGFIMIMKRLLPKSNFALMKLEIEKLTIKYPFVKMRYYGFRDDWKKVL